MAYTSAALVLELKLVPKSSHVVAVAQEIEVGGLALLVSVRTVQVVPPSVVVRTASPGTTNAIAAQKDTVGQETPNSPLTLPGNVWGFQVVPPLVVVSTKPALDVVAPTATQLEADAHEIPERLAPVGTVWLDQIVPPSVVATMPVELTFLPVNMLQVASQTVVDGHETAVSGPTPLGKVGAVHVVPPSVVDEDGAHRRRAVELRPHGRAVRGGGTRHRGQGDRAGGDRLTGPCGPAVGRRIDSGAGLRRADGDALRTSTDTRLR